MAVTVIPQVTNWTVTPQNGQAGYFGLMNTWLGQSTSVIASLQTAITAQNTANTEINALAIQTENNATIANGLANFQGAWSNSITYLKGQSVESTTGSKIYYISKVDSNLNHAVTDTNYWLYNPINDKLDKDISTYTSKTTPVDADLIPLSDSVASFGAKKLTWANLKATLISSFGVMINTLTAKTIPIDSDIFTIADSASSNASKKITWANLIGNIKNVAYKSTPVTITSWSYSGTTITLNVASHTFVAGDYIEVSGLTATTNAANGIQLVTSVTATTIVFTLGATPTGTAGVSSAKVKGYMTVNNRVLDITAVKNVTGSRVSGSIYQNTSGKTKDVVIVASTDYPLVLVGGEIISGISAGVRTITFPVPNGLSYSVTIASGTFVSWSETI